MKMPSGNDELRYSVGSIVSDAEGFCNGESAGIMFETHWFLREIRKNTTLYWYTLRGRAFQMVVSSIAVFLCFAQVCDV